MNLCEAMGTRLIKARQLAAVSPSLPIALGDRRGAYRSRTMSETTPMNRRADANRKFCTWPFNMFKCQNDNIRMNAVIRST